MARTVLHAGAATGKLLCSESSQRTRESVNRSVQITQVRINTMDKVDEACRMGELDILLRLAKRGLSDNRASNQRRWRNVESVLCGNFPTVSSSQL